MKYLYTACFAIYVGSLLALLLGIKPDDFIVGVSFLMNAVVFYNFAINERKAK